MAIKNKKGKQIIPYFFKPLLWSYDFNKIDSEKHKKTIIINGLNYGNLHHWSWIIKHYSRPVIKKTLRGASATEINPRTRKLASIIFSIEKFNYVLRGPR